jgi:hypothetical protein
MGYIESILARFSLTDAKVHATPMVPAVTYSKDNSLKNQVEVACMRKVPYREAIGSLIYATIAKRPDITFAISILSQFLDNLGEAHWEGVKQIFRYLAGMKDRMLTYGEERHGLLGYTNVDRASQLHHQAISGYAFLIDGGVVSWSSWKQELITLSTAEAEYIAAMHAMKECIWLRCLIGEIFPRLIDQTTLFCDNQATLQLVTDDNYHMCTKHIDICFHFIYQMVEDGSINLIYCSTDNMTANILTKALLHWKVATHVLRLGLCRASRGVLDSGTPGKPKAESDKALGSMGGHIACSTIAG